MNILLLPRNIASIPAITCGELNKHIDIQAKNVIQRRNIYTSTDAHAVFLPWNVSRKNPFNWLYTRVKSYYTLKKLIKWADVVHYCWGPYFPSGKDIKIAHKMKKAIFVEWLGSDIRNPNFLSSINPYYGSAFNNPYEYRKSEEASKAVQKMFARYNAIPFQAPEMSLYIDRKLFPRSYTLFQRVDLEDFEPVYPSLAQTRPLIVHAPSSYATKGTNFIIEVIDELKKAFSFEFKLIHNVKREEALKLVAQADVFLDQIILGGYGMAATEAMAMGKPVLAYIMPEVYKMGLSSDCPIVSTNPDNLKSNLIKLITEAQTRHQLGIRGRQFVEEYHASSKIGPYLIEIYRTELKKLGNAHFSD
ncbi:glycosyltransferase [Parapedobacter indicus]|uniref:Glycosyltransferase involved in cell wall bisynthesis n=1 Tax=Parapedobacter indicus TaxID=1477437 RepID=A0A1I3TG14_9SPHI|nr:glycosyltransferase [Parapedobacter indicus]PPK99543.1 glycosyltransferase involved in cell wall biosynthesis [Parapedobacter indicus]SFJ68596.1 Glycosyltransferase involved in cell wall bisynthesis [Parapedobacter indicus]